MNFPAEIKLAGATWGDPFSAATYSGVPFHLFGELTKSGHMVGRLDLKQSKLLDLLRGALDWKRTLKVGALRRNAFWRYLPETIDLLTGRMQAQYARLPQHEAILQFGVAGLPDAKIPLVAHVEIDVATAASLPIFASSYGFSRKTKDLLNRAVTGERYFLNHCAMVWTNSKWTAEGLRRQGVPDEKLWIHAPGCSVVDSENIHHRWDAPHILFVGKDWVRKGGPLLIEAFHLLRSKYSASKLTIIGCNPPVGGEGIRVLGFLDMQNPAEAALLGAAYQQATIFCMPSAWESVGLVYMEAAQVGLPVIMLRGQGRENIFPESMAVILDEPTPKDLADALVELVSDPAKMERMGQAGRRHVLQNYAWPVVARRLTDRINSVAKADGLITASPLA